MSVQKYQVNQYLIESILNWVKSEEIAIPEIQRPFVWEKAKVRDLLDSLYNGYPVGYLISWRNPDVKLKDGTVSAGKKILIDGQQRVTALTAALVGQEVVNKHYKKVRIAIAFNPTKETFEVPNAAIKKDPQWIRDVAPLLQNEIRVSHLVRDYCEKNGITDESGREHIEDVLEKLKNITRKQIGFIDLEPDLDIETVTEIFIRINSKGQPLSQADFAMSKLASESELGANLRKCIDYFCHLAVAPEYYENITKNDRDFEKTTYFQKIKWLKDEKDDLYDPDYNDLLRVSFTSKFNRGRLSELVSLLSGRNFETRTYEQEIVEDTFQKLEESLLNCVNETHFKRFLMIVKSAGFVSPSFIRSGNSLNFAYILFLKLRELNYPSGAIETFVKKWLVMSLLTQRYTSSPESGFDKDIKEISRRPFDAIINDVEAAQLSDAFWSAGLVQELTKHNVSNPYINVFFAAQVCANDKGFLSKEVTVRDMVEHRGDIHHIFPKAYLKTRHNKTSFYNQIANYAYTQTEINIQIGKKSPKEYFSIIREQIENGSTILGGIRTHEDLIRNLDMNAVPVEIMDMEIEHYDEFLEMRKKLMSDKIRDYYRAL